jgi:hypothetical protein
MYSCKSASSCLATATTANSNQINHIILSSYNLNIVGYLRTDIVSDHTLLSFNATQFFPVYCRTTSPVLKFHNRAMLSLLAVTK